jgi:UDP:flavonoid glycosyltransferase YjiC (YdhE family)
VAATILFLPSSSASGSWGSTVRLATIAEQCRQRGDRVVFHACEPTDDLLRRRGLDVVAFTGIAPPNRPAGPIDSFYDICAALGYGEPAAWEPLLRAEADLIADLRPDVIVADMRPTAPLSAARHGIPLASCAWSGADPRRQPSGEHPYDELARGVAARWCGLELTSMAELMYWRADRQLALSFPAFEPELADAPATVYTGYLRDPVPSRDELPPLPPRLVVVYASSSPWGVPGTVEALDAAARRAGVTVWCVLRSDTESRRYSDRCRVFRYLPMDQILPDAAALMFHGGLSTALASLHYGLPALAVPGRHYERRRNADRLSDIGSGLTGELTDLLPSRLSLLFERLLDDTTMRAAAGTLRAEAARYSGAGAAAAAVRELAGIADDHDDHVRMVSP